LNSDRVGCVAGRGYVGLFGRDGDRHAAVAFGVALLPLIRERGGAVRPRAVRLCERLALLGGAADRRGRGVGRRRDQYGGGLSRRGRAARAACIGRSLLNSDRVAYVAGRGYVGLFRRPRDRYAVVARAVALLPLLRKRSRAVRPRAVRLGERLALLGGAADRRRRGVRGYRRDDRGGGGRRRRGA